MQEELIYEGLLKIIAKENILINEPMKKHTTFKIGGPADFYITANNTGDVKNITKFAKDNDIKLTIIGNGSNVLVKDNGIRGITLKLNLKEISKQKTDNGMIYTVGSGTTLSQISSEALKDEMTGLEFVYRNTRQHWWCCIYECRSFWTEK